jgi:protein-tyrosine phosphatase
VNNEKDPLIIEIVPNLYLGNSVTACDAAFLARHYIKSIVNVTDGLRNCFPETHDYMRISVTNDLGVEIFDHFARACDFIDGRVKNGNRVMVHCMQGRGRSVTIVLAYLVYNVIKLKI